MNFLDVKTDIYKLIGLELESIRPGAQITITKIDEEKGILTLRTASGQMRNRPIEELQKIWTEMMIKPSVHVEGVLRGSGTSRNQPETILANLPYVEWLKVDNKKNIAYVNKKTHAYGTLKRMDPVNEVDIITKMDATKIEKAFSFIIVTKDIKQSISFMQKLCPGTVSTIEQGIYQLKSSESKIAFVLSDNLGLEEGTYCVIETIQNVNVAKRLLLCGSYYSIICQSDIKAFVKDK